MNTGAWPSAAPTSPAVAPWNARFSASCTSTTSSGSKRPSIIAPRNDESKEVKIGYSPHRLRERR